MSGTACPVSVQGTVRFPLVSGARRTPTLIFHPRAEEPSLRKLTSLLRGQNNLHLSAISTLPPCCVCLLGRGPR